MIFFTHKDRGIYWPEFIGGMGSRKELFLLDDTIYCMSKSHASDRSLGILILT